MYLKLNEIEACNIAQLSKIWSPDRIRDILELESKGKWGKIVDLFKNKRHLHFIERGILARSFIFLGNLKMAQKLLNENSTKLEVRTFLSRAALKRSNLDYEEALKNSLIAFELASKFSDKSPEKTQLMADSLFAEGLALAEIGRLYQALAVFSSIQEMKGVSDYRKKLALSNEGLILWDLGRVDILENLIKDLQLVYQVKYRLLLDLHQGKTEYLLSLLENKPNDLSNRDLSALIVILINGLLLLKDVLVQDVIKNSWIERYLESDVYIGDFKSNLFKKLISNEVCEELIKKAVNVIDQSDCWRNQIDGALFLSLISKRNEISLEIDLWESYIDKIVVRYKLMSPLIPYQRKGNSPWVSKLNKLFNDKNDMEIKKEFFYIIENGKILKRYEGIEKYDSENLFIQKSPTTTLALKFLSTIKKGDKVSKEDLHNAITSVKYVSSLHQSRLLKLLKRIENLFLKNNWEPPFLLKRDNFIHLEVDIRDED